MQGFKNYYRHKKDNNCIKRHSLYTSGKYAACNSDVISLKKIKAFAKEHKATIGDITMAMASTVFAEHFKKKDDPSDLVTFAIPFSFKVIPQSVRDYVYGN